MKVIYVNTITRSKTPKNLFRAVAAVAVATVCLGASAALPAFTFNPAAVGLTGTQFTADNLLISDYATVTATLSGFTESGFLAITGAQLGSTTFQPTGMNTTYGLYLAFSATGTNAFQSNGFYGGNVTSLSYTLHGYNGPASFTPTSAPTSAVTLGTGTLIDGTVSGTLSGTNVTSANASLRSTFAADGGSAGFFVSPVPFYTMAVAAFSNTGQQILNTPTGFVVTQGGGTINFVAAPVPEPETYAMLLVGLGVIGSIAVRRNKAKTG